MSLSVKKTLTEILAEDTEGVITSFDLLKCEIQKGSQPAQLLDLDAWPILQFLKGMGFESLKFNTNNADIIEAWAQRISEYEQVFLQDPENLSITESRWNESEASGKTFIECTRSDRVVGEVSTLSSFVPPMEAPLGIDPEAVKRFAEEVENQSTQETILRIQSILSEYREWSEIKDVGLWAILVADTISVALENKLLEKAYEIAEEHEQYLKELWEQEDRVLRLFSAYDPKPTEISQWARIFRSCNFHQLIRLIEKNLGTSAGPQIVKLMNFRAQNPAEDLLDLCLNEKPEIQRILVPWFSANWRPKHFERIKELLTTGFKSDDSFMAKLWLQALLRSDSPNALRFLKEHFKKKFFVWSSQKNSHIKVQKIIIDLLCENPNNEVLGFAREIKKQVLGGELRDKLEKLIRSYSV